jgi:Flp pilus assembly protein TadD
MDDAIRTSEDEYLDALDLMDDGDYAAALPILARLVAFEPDNDEIYAAWLDAHIGLGRYQRAIELADGAIAQGRSRRMAEMWKAIACRKMGRLDEAEASVRAALALEPSSSSAVVFLTSILEEQGRQAEALEFCTRAAAENPEDEDLARRFIDLADAMDRHDLVVESCREYLRRFEKSGAVLSYLGNAYLDLGEDREAERAFRDAAALEPELAEHHANLVMAMMLRGDQKGADAYLDKLASRDEELANEVDELIDALLAAADEE